MRLNNLGLPKSFKTLSHNKYKEFHHQFEFKGIQVHQFPIRKYIVNILSEAVALGLLPDGANFFFMMEVSLIKIALNLFNRYFWPSKT